MASRGKPAPKGGGKAGNGKPERGKKSGKGNGQSKPTAEALSDQQRQALLFNHRKKIKPLIDAQKNATGVLAHAFELAKKEGIPKKDILLAIQLESDEGVEAAKNDLERTNRIARWLGVGKQLTMFGDSETMAQRHFEDGRRSALNDQPARPPEHLGTKDANTWLEGHSAGRTTLNESRIRQMAPLGDAAAALIEKAAAKAGFDPSPPPSTPTERPTLHG